jgi:hypothetical protein
MSDENTEIFLDFWKTYQWPDPVSTVYRLYHDDQGRPIEYSNQDRPGKYIELTIEQFAQRSHNVVVQNGQLVELTPQNPTQKLAPSRNGTSCHPLNVAIVVDTELPNTKWKLIHYENS